MDKDLFIRVLPIGVSLLALVVSAISLGWNIYRDIVLKARLRVTFNASSLHGGGLQKPIETLVLTGTNFGPGAITCNMIQLEEAPLWRRLLRKKKYAVMIHDYENPLSGRLPKKLEVGEKIDLLIRWERDSFLSKPYTHIGISDSFGRVHWAPASAVEEARKTYREKYPGAPLSA